jgi:hypothetical protein
MLSIKDNIFEKSRNILEKRISQPTAKNFLSSFPCLFQFPRKRGPIEIDE